MDTNKIAVYISKIFFRENVNLNEQNERTWAFEIGGTS